MTKEEFKTCVLPVKEKLLRLAITLLSSRAEAEDTVQDAYVKLWNMRQKLAEYNSVEALAVTITKNLCIDKLRSYRSRKQNEGGLETLTMTAERQHDPALRLEMSESLQHIHRIISRLPDQQRTMLHLRDIEQHSYDEIESITGLKRNNIRVTLSRARKEVRRKYSKIVEQ
jgi:RNA polymerase sigma-70 factor (ECF subfamily)